MKRSSQILPQLPTRSICSSERTCTTYCFARRLKAQYRNCVCSHYTAAPRGERCLTCCIDAAANHTLDLWNNRGIPAAVLLADPRYHEVWFTQGKHRRSLLASSCGASSSCASWALRDLYSALSAVIRAFAAEPLRHLMSWDSSRRFAFSSSLRDFSSTLWVSAV